MVWSAEYTAFGEATVDTDSTVENSLRFPGQYFDEETNLHYNWLRYFDPTVGRYQEKDPLSFRAGDQNLYRYVRNRPSGLTDSSGACPMCIGAAIGASINFVSAMLDKDATPTDVLVLTLIGGASGAVGTIPMGGIITSTIMGAIIGGGNDVVGQLYLKHNNNKCKDRAFDTTSLAYGVISGALGGGVASALGKIPVKLAPALMKANEKAIAYMAGSIAGGTELGLRLEDQVVRAGN